MNKTDFGVCSNCGAKLESKNAIVCVKCGTATGANSNTTVLDSSKQMSRGTIAAAIAFGCLVIYIGLSFVTSIIPCLVIPALFITPPLVYFYLGRMRKGIIYEFLFAALITVHFIAYYGSVVVLGFVSMGVLAPLGLGVGILFWIVEIILSMIIIWDGYRIGKGEKDILPG